MARAVIVAPEPSTKNRTPENRPTPSITPVIAAKVRRGLRSRSRQAYPITTLIRRSVRWPRSADRRATRRPVADDRRRSPGASRAPTSHPKPAAPRARGSTTAVAFLGSSDPVGSSATISFGWCARARATATRWRCPPDSWSGSLHRPRRPGPSSTKHLGTAPIVGAVTIVEGDLRAHVLRTAVRYGSRSSDWKTSPRSCLLARARSSASIDEDHAVTDGDGPGRRNVQAGDQAEQRRLAAAAGKPVIAMPVPGSTASVTPSMARHASCLASSSASSTPFQVQRGGGSLMSRSYIGDRRRAPEAAAARAAWATRCCGSRRARSDRARARTRE